MRDKEPNFFPENLLDQLRIINGIKFTHREVDILAFLICGRAVKKIASFLSIAPKTVENHTHNIMIKLGCNSRESIIDFIEKSDKLLILRKYYATLLAYASFEKSLNEVAQLTKERTFSCILTYWEEQDSNLLASSLEKSLNLAKINVSTVLRTSSQSLESLCKESYVIYIMPKNQEGHILDRQESALLSKYASSRVLLFFPGRRESIEVLKNFETDSSLDYLTQNCYLLRTCCKSV